MATYYFDPDGGNNANDGLSFANRKQTWGMTFANGDEARIMAARDPYSLGNGTWVNGSNTITLAAAKTLNIDTGDTAWTPITSPGPNTATTVTTAFGTAQHIWREGTGYSRIGIVAGHVTGVAAYRALGATLDLSGYTAISFRYATSVAVTAGNLRLDLCSDAAGAVPVASFSLPVTIANTPMNVYLENGGALPANVNSIALYVVTDFGAVNVGIDNLIACQSRGHADHLCHDSLVGKMTSGEPEWWPIRSINGTALSIGDPLATPSAPGRLYPGVSETVPVYTYQVQRITATPVITNNGAVVTFTGGWDRTAMTTQSGETVLSGMGCYTGAAFSQYSNPSKISKVSYTGFVRPTTFVTQSGNVDMQGSFVSGCIEGLGSLDNVRAYNIDRVLMCNLLGTNAGSNPWNGRTIVRSKLIGECREQYGLFDISTNIGGADPLRTQSDFKVDKFRNNASVIGRLAGGVVYLRDSELTGNLVDFSNSAMGGLVVLENCTFSRTPDTDGSTAGGAVVYTKRNGDARLCGYWQYLFSCETQTAVVPATGDTAAWRMEYRTNSVEAANPLVQEIARYPVEAGQGYELTYEGRRAWSSTNGVIRVVDDHGVVLGTGVINGTVNTWVGGTVAFTPTEDGYVNLEFGGYGNAANECYVANLVISEV